jgi:hypothetical protein
MIGSMWILMTRQRRSYFHFNDQTTTVLLPLVTRDQRSSANHRSQTPKSTAVPAHPVVPQATPTIDKPTPSARPPKGLVIPAGTKPFTPSPSSTLKQPLTFSAPPTKRDLTDAFAGANDLPPYPGMAAVPLRRFDPLLASVHTYATRQDAPGVFLTCC